MREKMKKIKKLPLMLAAGVLIALTALIFALTGKTSAPTVAHAYDTRFAFTSYSVTYDLRSDRTMDVQLDLEAKYLGYSSRGFIYDIPVNAGDRVRNLKAYSLDTGFATSVEYSIENEDSDFISVYMDDDRIKYGETHSYRITYEYAITKPVSKNNIYLNAIGFGSEATIANVSVVVNLPDGWTDTHCYVGRRGTTEEFVDYTVNGNSVALGLDGLDRYNGITFDFEFADGVLSTKPDMTPYWIIIGACAVFAVLFAVKLLCFNKNNLTPIPCFSVPANPPEGIKGAKSVAFDDPTLEMDPLIMGKLIDNKVDNSDITSLIYYWASKGYIKINMQNEKDVVLIRIYNALPENSPNYQKTMYSSLFKSGEVVHINSLTNTFYSTVERVTKEVNSENGKLYEGKSMAFAILFALIGAAAMCVTPIAMALLGINRDLLLIAPFFMIVPVFIIFALTQTVKYRTLKFKKSKLILLYGAVGLLALVFCALYLVLVPSYVIELLPKFILAAVGFAIVMLSVSLISRADDYTEKLNRIVGFKEFIETVEKDKLEEMLESNPEFYYNVLPYAIVLGVSDKWADKFEGLTVKPPQWSTGSMSDTIFNIMIFNSVMRNVNINMTKTFLSRPSSGSSSGFRGGGGHGGFGGFSGGGHGGGGFRGR